MARAPRINCHRQPVTVDSIPARTRNSTRNPPADSGEIPPRITLVADAMPAATARTTGSRRPGWGLTSSVASSIPPRPKTPPPRYSAGPAVRCSSSRSGRLSRGGTVANRRIVGRWPFRRFRPTARSWRNSPSWAGEPVTKIRSLGPPQRSSCSRLDRPQAKIPSAARGAKPNRATGVPCCTTSVSAPAAVPPPGRSASSAWRPRRPAAPPA